MILRVLVLSCAMVVFGSCEPILDFTQPDPTTPSGQQGGILQPTAAQVRPKEAVDVPANPIVQLTLLSNDSSKGWQLKRRLRQGIEVSDACLQDDGLIIHESQRIDFVAGALKCGTEDRDISGIWQLTDRPSLLLRVDSTTPYEAQLLGLSTNRMILSYINEEGVEFQDVYETPVAQEPLEEAPIVLTTPTPQPTSTASSPASNPSANPSANPDEESTAEVPTDTGEFKSL